MLQPHHRIKVLQGLIDEMHKLPLHEEHATTLHVASHSPAPEGHEGLAHAAPAGHGHVASHMAHEGSDHSVDTLGQVDAGKGKQDEEDDYGPVPESHGLFVKKKQLGY